MPLSGSFTSNFQNAVLDVLSGKGILDAPLDGLKLGLFTADPGESGGTSSELTGNGYARATFSVGASATNGSYQGEISNSAQIDFPSATGTWSGITHAAVFRTKSQTRTIRGTSSHSGAGTDADTKLLLPASVCTVSATLTVTDGLQTSSGDSKTLLNVNSNTAGTYNGVDGLGNSIYFVRVKTGPLSGLCFEISTDGTNSLTVLHNHEFSAEAINGQSIDVCEKPTIETWSGSVPASGGSTNLPSGLLAGSSSTADRVYLIDSAEATSILYPQQAPAFSGGDGWRLLGASASADQGTIRLPPQELLNLYDNTVDDYAVLRTTQTADWTLTSQLSTTDDLVVRLAFEDSGGNAQSLSVTSGQNLQIASGDLKITLD